MNEELLAQIEELGLSEKEARVYLANLMIGPTNEQKIADQAEIKRVTTYVILESLSNLGLVSKTNQGKKTYFTAEDPVSLHRLLEKKEQQIKEQKTAFESLLPELHSLKNLPSESPNVKFYEGAEAIRSVFSTFFSEHQKEIDKVYGMSNLDQLHEFFPETARELSNPQRVAHKIPSQFVYTSTRGQIYKNADANSMRISRWIPAEEYPFQGDMNVMGNYVVLLSFAAAKPIGIVINSKEIATGMRAIFELAWTAAEKYNKA